MDLKRKVVEYLKKIDEWEAKLIVTDECWDGEYPQFTKELYDEWMELQKERNELLGAIQ
jgi:hypothetical protein